MQREVLYAIATTLLWAWPARGDLPDDVATCTSISVASKRLKCFDELARKLKPRASPPSSEEEGRGWRYSNYTDKMSDIDYDIAAISSVEPFQLSAPYAGDQYAILMLRRAPLDKYDLTLGIKRGQFLCGAGQGCYVLVRFDQAKSISVEVARPADHDTTVLIFRKLPWILHRLRTAKRVFIAADFYQEGRRVFEFDVAGLRWDLPALQASGKVCRATFDCPIEEKCSATTKQCMLCTSFTDEGTCADADMK
jgi:hypothetical protein